MAQFTGIVAWFNNSKGYGFLKREGGPDVFCRYSAIQTEGYKAMKQEEIVEFDIVEGDKGKPQAANVVVVRNTPIPSCRSGT